MFEQQTYPADRAKMYEIIAGELRALVDGERDAVANLANAAALLAGALERINWVGFYRMDAGQLLLGPFQGKPACIRIPVGRGVCGAAARDRQTQLVADVHAFPGHIACDAASASEIVVPLFFRGVVVGVLDIDSPELGRFDDVDRRGLENFARILQAACDWRDALDVRLVAPAPEHERQALAYRDVCIDRDGGMHGDGGLEGAKTYAQWLEELSLYANEETVPAGFVPANTYFLQRVRDGKIVGSVNIRHRLNDFLMNFGGHIGYGIHPDERRKGYATQMLALALEKCRELGIERALLTCDKENPASARTMLRNGAVLENEIPEEGRITQRYWIEI